MVPEAIASLLHHCSKTKDFWKGLCLHAVVLKTGLQSNVFISNHVLNMYAKCGYLSLAHKVFDKMSEHNLISWSAIISGYAQHGEHWLALDMFSKMQLPPNEYIYASAVSACASLAALELGLQIHAQTIKSGYECISFVSNSLISMYMKCGQCRSALSVHNSVVNPNPVSYNALITGYIENHEPGKGFEVFKCMHKHGLVPDSFTFVGLLGFCTESNDLRTGMALHCQTIKLKLYSTPLVGNMIMAMYAKSNCIEEVEKAFALINDKDVVSWNSVISALSHSSDQTKCIRYFREMRNECRTRPDDFTFASILAACASNTSILLGKQIHAYLIRERGCQDIGVSNALVSMYAKSGSIDYAHNVFNNMSCHNLISWNTMIAAFGNHGHGDRAIEIFEQMGAAGIKPDSITIVALLIACNHAGFVDKGECYFNSMKEKYGINPNVEHFSCLIDMLGRAGRLSEAEDYLKKYHQWNDPVVLGSLLSACRLHGNITTGEWLARQLLQCQPISSSPYVLLFSLYASDERWDEAANARKMVKDSGLRKEIGYSLVELKGNYEIFSMGDFSHLRFQEIKHVIGTLCCTVGTVFCEGIT